MGRLTKTTWVLVKPPGPSPTDRNENIKDNDNADKTPRVVREVDAVMRPINGEED